VSQPFTNSAIVLENQKPGTMAWLLANPAVPGQIEGYASLTSVNRGGQINLLVNTTNSTYAIEVYRIGWYGGAGGRQVFGPVTVPGTAQAIPPMAPFTRLVECNWTNPYTLAIPAMPNDPTDWASGVYLAKLTGTQDGAQSYIIFAVRDDARPTDLLLQLSFNTYQAYNNWGGASLYDYNSKSGRAAKVSFNRPFASLSPYWQGSGEFFFGSNGSAAWECNLVRWIEREGYDVSYCTSVDTHALLLTNHRGFITMGHDEYWSYPMRWNVQAERDRGMNLGFFSADTAYWQVRFEPSTVDGTPNRNLVCYKSTADPVFNTPSNYLTTVGFRSFPVLNCESSLVGVSFIYAGPRTDMMINDPTHWIFAKTGLQAGQRLLGLLGSEADSTNGFSPAGIQIACASPYLDVQDQPKAPTLGYSQAATYNAPRGATVFASGSMAWSWGLDDFNAPSLRLAYQNASVQQITRNILAQLRNQPPPSATLFFRTDLDSRGNWKPRYGIEGYVLPTDSTNLPAFATLSGNGATVISYLTSSSDPNSLQQSRDGGRVLSGWSSPTNFTMDLNLSDGQNHEVAFYFWDWNNAGRVQRVDLVDATTANLLDRRTVAAFTNGQWWVWQVNGHVQFQITNLAGPDCLANALTLGSGAAAQFVGQDAVTQGNWPPFYGSDGAYIAGDAPIPPAYGTMTIGDTRKLTTWSLATTDPRAPVPPGATNCVFAAWGATGNSFNTFDLYLTDNAWHQLAVYCVDTEQLGRNQELSLVDTANNTLLDTRTLTDFGNGKYLVWNIRGRMRLRLLPLGGPPAALSGIFLGPPNLPPTVALTNPLNLQVFGLPTNIVLTAAAADSDDGVAQVSFYANGGWLGTATSAPFTLTWTNATVGQYSLTAIALDSRMAAATSLPVTITVAAPANYQPPVVQITAPADGSTNQVPTSMVISAAASYTSAPITSLQFLLDGAPVGPPLTTPPFTWTIGSLYAGVHSLSAIVTDAFGLTASAPTNVVTLLPATAGAVTRPAGLAPPANWQGIYGSEGFVIINLVTNLPAYAAAGAGNASSTIWAASTSDPRALQKPNRPDRFAGAWYGYTNFVLDLQLMDGNPHRVALYCVDWNMQGGNQAIQVLDGGTGALLGSSTLTSFTNGAYVVWDVVGHVQFQFSRTPTNIPAVLTGIFFDPPRAVPAVSLLWPTNGSRFVAPANTVLGALAVVGSAPLTRVEFLTNGMLLGVDPTGPVYTLAWPSVLAGSYSLAARAVDLSGSNAVSQAVSITVEPTSAAAFFALSSASQQGNWVGVYGQQGYLVAGDSTNLPPFAIPGIASQFVPWTSSTTDPRALQSSSRTARVAAAWYDFTNVILDVEFTDAAFHRLALYFLDWLNLGGTESVDVQDSVSGAALDHRVVPPFTNGIFDVWDVKGHLKFRITRPTGAPAMVSGLFFDVSPRLPAIVITNPPGGSPFYAPANITVSADGAADPIVKRVDFYQGTNLVSSVSAGPPYTFVWTNVPPGSFTLTAREISSFGTADSAPIGVNVFPLPDLWFGGPVLLPGGLLQLTLLAPPGQSVRLEAATNLGSGAVWVPLLTNVSGSNQFRFVLPDPGNYANRFYRAVALP
jgi:hypothetical protein